VRKANLIILGFGRGGGNKLNISTIDKKILDQVTCFDIFNCI